jgi:hypothetical protein
MNAATSFALAVALVVVSPGYAVSTLHEVSPDNLKAAGFTLAITHEHLADGRVNFRVVVTEDAAKFSSHTPTDLSVVERTPNTSSIRPGRKLASKREGSSLVCTFSVDRVALDDRRLCFVFTNYVEMIINGKLHHMPAAEFIYARLKDFARKTE